MSIVGVDLMPQVKNVYDYLMGSTDEFCDVVEEHTLSNVQVRLFGDVDHHEDAQGEFFHNHRQVYVKQNIIHLSNHSLKDELCISSILMLP